MKEKYLLAFMDMAERFGQTSTAERLKVGTLLIKDDRIISLGVNGTPKGWPSEVCEGPDGQTWPHVRHSELAALNKLRSSPESAVGSTMVVSHSPCQACAIEIVDSGVKALYYRHEYRSDDGLRYLLAKGVEVYKI